MPPDVTEFTVPQSLDPVARTQPLLLDLGSSRYRDLGLVGAGGMGEVRRVWDRTLDRPVVMKLLRLPERSNAQRRFEREARVHAGLQHPGIVPVYDLGQLPDGRMYFTMREVVGRTLGVLLRESWASWRAGSATPADGSFRRLIDLFHRVCETVAYAHAHGVLHRDLKPENILVGSFGEVQVIDWGLARAFSTRPDEEEDSAAWPSGERAQLTMVGTVAGTPAYMPPEQARGELTALSARADVYALGAVLYEILSGAPPFPSRSMEEVLDAVLSGEALPALPVSDPLTGDRALAWLAGGQVVIPADLVLIQAKAMAWSPDDRFATALPLAAEVGAWLDQSRRRDQALQSMSAAQTLLPEAERNRQEAATLATRAREHLSSLPPYAPVAAKAEGWALQDAAREAHKLAGLRELEATRLLQAALSIDPASPEPHDLLADLYQARQVEAELNRRPEEAAQYEALVRVHGAHRYRGWLQGDGALTLRTDPPCASVLLYREEIEGRRLVPRPLGSPGETPIHGYRLAAGSYRVVLRAPGRTELTVPVQINRGEQWDNTPPEGGEPEPLVLPPEGAWDPDEVPVAPGWFWSGGDPEADGALPRRRLWVDGFILNKYPITNREFLSFLNDLVAQGRGEEASRHAPRPPGSGGQASASIYGLASDGRWELRPDAEGDEWDPDWPVLLVDWWGAAAYAAWRAERDGLPWRLPAELEWEKAARGVDGRYFPWGDTLDATFCNMRESRPGRPLPCRVKEFPGDESPFGARGMAGNARDWCLDRARQDGPPVHVSGRVWIEDPGLEPGARITRGGAWIGAPLMLRAAYRNHADPTNRRESLSFRLARPWR